MIPPTDIPILFTNYDITTYFLNLASCSEHFISIKYRILATFNINKKNSILTACMPLRTLYLIISVSHYKNDRNEHNNRLVSIILVTYSIHVLLTYDDCNK